MSRECGRDAIRIDDIGVKAFWLQPNVVRLLIWEHEQLLVEGRAVAGTTGLVICFGKLMKMVPHDLVCGFIRGCEMAVDESVLEIEPVESMSEAEPLDVSVALLRLQASEVD